MIILVSDYKLIILVILISFFLNTSVNKMPKARTECEWTVNNNSKLYW